MMLPDDEEKLLRSVAMQNAKSILLARQRAEEDLVAAKEALELKTQELAHSLAMMRATLESTTDGILVTDPAGNVTGFNEKYVQMWGLSLDRDDLKQHWLILNKTNLYFDEPRHFLERIQAIYDSSPSESYDLLELSDGRVFERFSKIQFVAGQNAGRVWSFRDITQRRQAEQQLKDSEKGFRQLADAMPQIVWTAKPDGTVDYYNHRWFEYIRPENDSAEDDQWDRFVHADDLSPVQRRWADAVESGKPHKVECRIVGADGTYRWFLGRALPVADDRGNIVRWFGTWTDIHEEKETADELRNVAARLSEADRRKDEFIAMLAHELRNPLAPIRNALQIMRATDDMGTGLHSASEMMERQVRQLVRLVDDLLDVSRISRGKISLRRDVIELGSVISDATEVARESCESGGVELSVKASAEPILLNGDAARLTQAVGNLLNNSCKFTDKGGRIELSVDRESDGAVIRVRDTGIGISPDQIPYIFDMFVQADTSLERTASGLGIGLKLVKNLVEMHGGTVEASSAGIGKGSEFVVRLPAITDFQELPRYANVTPASKASVAGRRILVVDDNLDSAESMSLLLEISGHDVRTAHDGVAAVETASSFRPEIVLLDIGLPKLNGYEAARKIRSEDWGKSMYLMALTGWGQDKDRQRSKEAGFDCHLVKPIDPVELMKRLADVE